MKLIDLHRQLTVLSLRLREARVASGLTQRELALLMGCSTSLIGHHETRYRTDAMKISLFLRVAEALQIEPQIFFASDAEFDAALDALIERRRKELQACA